jgi:hypothetical protein
MGRLGPFAIDEAGELDVIELSERRAVGIHQMHPDSPVLGAKVCNSMCLRTIAATSSNGTASQGNRPIRIAKCANQTEDGGARTKLTRNQ